MRIIFIFLLLPLKLFSQEIEGVWTGTIYNDTTRKYIPYEIAITESKGKLSGYSHTIFVGENNKQETGVKSLKIKKRGEKILIEDDELIYNNYTEPPPKGVRQYSVLNIMPGDSGLLLVGVFNTNRTREYSSLTGTIHLKKKEKVFESKLIPKLGELHLASSLSFIQNKEKAKNDVAIQTSSTKKIEAPSQPKQEKEIMTISQTKTEQTSSSNKNVIIKTDSLLIAFKEDTVDYKVDVIPKDFAINERQKKEITKIPETTKKKERVPKPEKETVSKPVVIKDQADIELQKETTVALKENKTAISQPKEKNITSSIPPDKKTEQLPQQNIIKKETLTAPIVIKKQSEIQPEKQTAIISQKENKTSISQPKEKIITSSIPPPDKKIEQLPQQNTLKKETLTAPIVIKKQSEIQPEKQTAIISQKENKTSISQPKEKIITPYIPPPVKNTEQLPQQNIIKKETVTPQPIIKKQEDNSLPKEKIKEPEVMISKPVQRSILNSVPIISSAELAKRTFETIRTVDFKSDSLVLTLYDNGVVDGDTVSVILNGKIIMPKQGLSTKAITKTIYITPDLGDSLQLIMYAENLGSIPPNTGLLIIQDGEDRYQIRFAGDLQKNSAIILRRKVISQ